MAFTLYEHCNDGDGTLGTIVRIYDSSARRGLQQFTAESTHELTLVRTKGYKEGSPAGDYVVEIYAVDGDGKPTGSALASGSMSASDFPTSSDWVRIIMSSSMTVTNAVMYVIVTKAVDTDGTNKLINIGTSISVYAGGAQIYSNDGGANWTINSSNDAGFEIGEAGAVAVTTNAATNVKDTHCLGNGDITDDGGAYITERGFEYGTSEEAQFCVRQTGTNLGTGTYSSTIGSLQPETTYYYRAYCTNSEGDAYGDWVSFTTNASPSYGVYEESNSPTISFYLSEDDGKTWGQKHGPYTTDQADIEVTKLLVRGSGKKKIKFTSDVLTGISASVMVKLDCKAR